LIIQAHQRALDVQYYCESGEQESPSESTEGPVARGRIELPTSGL